MPSVIVVGTGIAGLVAALRAARTHHVTLVTKAEFGESNTRYAQGGIAAALSADDSVRAHIDDTLAAGAGLNARVAVEILCTEGPDRIRDLLLLAVVRRRTRAPEFCTPVAMRRAPRSSRLSPRWCAPPP
jgi:L-aspartate oxidase